MSALKVDFVWFNNSCFCYFIKGIKGESGNDGFGTPGDTGLQGQPGNVGEKGNQGPRGEKGFEGFKGSPGQIGVKGQPGIKIQHYKNG